MTAHARVYVAASWRTPQQPEVVAAIRAAGVTVYDFRNPPNRAGFGWEQINGGWKEWTPAEYVEALGHPLAVAGFESDITALVNAYVCVLVQPSGRSAALELGYAAGMGKRCAVLLAPGQEPELMLKVAEYLTDSLPALVEWIRGLRGLRGGNRHVSTSGASTRVGEKGSGALETANLNRSGGVKMRKKPKANKRAVRAHKSRSQGALLVRGIRRRLKLTQKAFAAKLGVAQMTISRWESGECPVSAAMRLALRVVAAEPKPAKRPVVKAKPRKA